MSELACIATHHEAPPFVLLRVLVDQWRIQGGFLVARKPPPAMIFFNHGRDTLAGTDLH